MIKKWIIKNRASRVNFLKNEMNKNVLKSLLSVCYDFKSKAYFSKLLWKMGKFSSLSFCRRYCVISFKTKSVLRRFKLNRHLCKKYASDGFLVGMRKSSF